MNAVDSDRTERAVTRIGLQSTDRLRREVLAAYLQTLDRFKVVGPVARARDAAALCGLERVDVMLLDAERDPVAAIDAAGTLREKFPDLRVALMYDRVLPGHVTLAQARGVAAMVPCSHGLAAILKTVTGLADGIAPTPWSRTGLSDRQREILLLLVSGHNTVEIGDLLRISPGTVENHKRRVYAKLGASSAVEAIARAAALGIVDGAWLDDRVRAPQAMDDWRHPSAAEDGHPVLAVAIGQPVADVDRAVYTLIVREVPVIREVHPDPAVRVHWLTWHRGPVVRVLVNPVADQWRIAATLGSTTIVVHSGPIDQSVARHVLANGGAAVLPADDIEEQLVPVVRLAAKGYLVIGPGAAPFQDSGYLPLGERRVPVPDLTAREFDILRSIGRHRTVRQTARSLGIALKTVENTQGHLFRKLGVHSRAEALVTAYSLGLLQPDTEA